MRKLSTSQRKALEALYQAYEDNCYVFPDENIKTNTLESLWKRGFAVKGYKAGRPYYSIHNSVTKRYFQDFLK